MVATPNALTGTCGGGTFSATAETSSVSLTTATLAGAANCTFSVNVTGTTAGVKNNSVTVTSTNGGTGNTSTASVSVIGAPSITKTFGAASLTVGGSTSLSFTVTNPNASTGLTGVAFTDTLPAGLVVATPNALTGTCGGGAITATAGASSVSLATATLAGAANCTFSVNVTGTTAGVKNNSVTVTSTNGGTGNTSTASVTVISPPSITKSFGATGIAIGGSASLSFTVTNPNATGSLTGVTFTDTLPAGLVVSSPNALTGTCGGGTITATAGASSVGLAAATLAGAASCTFSVNVTGTTAGVKNNSVTVTSANGGTGNTSNASVTVAAPPSITKSFSPNKFVPGGTTSVTFSITNPNSVIGLTGVGFTDSLPSGLTVANPNGLSSTCGGTATATAGSGTISLSGGSIASGGNCTVTANVTAPEGTYLNSVTVTSANGGTGSTSSATVFVATPPSLSKTFGEVSIGPGSSAALSFTLINPNHTVTLDALQFSDTLPAGLVISTPNGLTGSCGGGTITAPAGNNLITVGSAVLAPQASCTFSVNVTSDGTLLGLLTNTTSTVTSTEALSGAPASAVIFIGDPFQVSYAANLNIGESYIDITNTGTSGAPLLGPGLGGASGNICVNVYAFDASEELISCCSCLVTPDQTVNLGASRDLTAKTLTGVVPTSVTVKVLATLAGAGGSGTSCTNTAATSTAAGIANGMAAWGTTLHPTPTAGSYATTEKGFTGATLSAGELASITGRCAAIIGNGSGFGICSSCRSGALGGSNLPQ